jgi:hypothetical protein
MSHRGNPKKPAASSFSGPDEGAEIALLALEVGEIPTNPEELDEWDPVPAVREPRERIGPEQMDTESRHDFPRDR